MIAERAEEKAISKTPKYIPITADSIITVAVSFTTSDLLGQETLPSSLLTCLTYSTGFMGSIVSEKPPPVNGGGFV